MEQTDRLAGSISPQAVGHTMAEIGEAGPTLVSPGKVRRELFWQNLKENWAIFAENPVGLIGLGLIVIFALMALSYPVLRATIWDATDPLTGGPIFHPVVGFDSTVGLHPAAPTARHILGTDPLGRDVLSQLLYSTFSEFLLGMVAALITVVIGTTTGAIAAYFGDAIDTVLMRVADLVIMTPGLSLLIVLSALWQLNLLKLAVVLGLLSGFGATTVIIKSQALTVKVKPFIEAARVSGGSHMHIIFTHIVPNLLPIAFLYMMFTVTGAIFTEAILSFFGLMNIRMSWGVMIYLTQSQGYMLSGLKYWWLLFPSSLAITLLSAAFYLVGRALDEVVNPRLRKR